MKFSDTHIVRINIYTLTQLHYSTIETVTIVSSYACQTSRLYNRPRQNELGRATQLNSGTATQQYRTNRVNSTILSTTGK